jgi:hypothetical protein
MTFFSTALDRFRTVVESDPTLPEQLNAPDDPAQFVALAVVIAQRHDIALGADELAAAMELPRQADNPARLPPQGWLPMRAHWRDGELWLDWSYVGSRQLREPFFDETVGRCAARPLNRWLRYASPVRTLPSWLNQHPGLPPTGFIFHMSRCGSTLAAQMLAAVADNVVLAEAAPIDAVVQARATLPDLDDDTHADWLRWIVGALGQPRGGAERHLFVKLDSWHSLALPLFRRAFPDVPWIFLYREPVEVLVSQLRQRGSHTVPGLVGDVFDLGAAAAALPPERYCAQVLGRICDGALRDYAPGQGLLVNYRQLPEAVWSHVLPHFGMTCSAADHAAMAEAARHDAKQPDLPFNGDSAAKQALAGDSIQVAAADLAGRYARLEALRLAT